jgi:hypothetical protein
MRFPTCLAERAAALFACILNADAAESKTGALMVSETETGWTPQRTLSRGEMLSGKSIQAGAAVTQHISGTLRALSNTETSSSSI